MIVPENKPKAEQKIVAAEKKQDKFLFSSKLKPGHKFWELNVETKELAEAEIERYSYIDKDGNPRSRGKLKVKKNCSYVPALNMENAEKRFKKIGAL